MIYAYNCFVIQPRTLIMILAHRSNQSLDPNIQPLPCNDEDSEEELTTSCYRVNFNTTQFVYSVTNSIKFIPGNQNQSELLNSLACAQYIKQEIWHSPLKFSVAISICTDFRCNLYLFTRRISRHYGLKLKHKLIYFIMLIVSWL